ncbi:MAG: CDP-alcohol phosphatidyltransferase family protein [Parachlamydiaceae bacterium]|nr:CDP-alcohol phosphatidyltransferase family protein [Parachlamydiaceae bacterium]
MIATPSNLLSISRGFLALLFLSDSVLLRTISIVLAMITDSLDGYLARRWRMTSSFGATIDPLMDKFFVIFILAIFIGEGRLAVWQSLTLISRDFAVLIFGFYITIKGSWSFFKFRSIWAGKVATTMQFFTLIALTLNMGVSNLVYFCFIFVGVVALIELCVIEHKLKLARKSKI